MEKINLKVVIGIILIIAAVVISGLYLKSYYDEKNVEKNVTKEKKAEKKKEENIDKQIQSKKTIKKVDTSIKYRICPEIKERLNIEEFDKQLKKYLEYNNLFVANTTATCRDKVLTLDYKKHYMSFNLYLNDKRETRVICAISDDRDYSFDHIDWD